MAVLSREDYFNELQKRLGDDKSEEGIAFLENMTDTYNSLEQRANGDGIDWEKRCKDLDDAWKARYANRFFSGGVKDVPATAASDSEDEEYSAESVTVKKLFT